MEFRDGSTVLTTVALTASGVATFSTTSLTVGTHPITAVYAGNTNYAGVTSNLVTQTVVTPDYTLSANPTSITIVQGGSGQSTITATAVGGFNSTSCHVRVRHSWLVPLCGGSSTPKPANQTPKGSYTVPLTIYGGSLSHTLDVNVTVQ